MFLCIMTQYTKMTNKVQLYRVIYYSLAALHVSRDIFAHHQEHLNCITASGITHVCRCRLAATYVSHIILFYSTYLRVKNLRFQDIFILCFFVHF
jgi:hypothetical protein